MKVNLDIDADKSLELGLIASREGISIEQVIKHAIALEIWYYKSKEAELQIFETPYMTRVSVPYKGE